MFLATAEESSFSEMGLKLRLDFPEQAMDFISVFFRTSTSASEAAVTIPIFYGASVKEYAKSLGEQRARNMKIDAFPGDMEDCQGAIRKCTVDQ
ncbi:hypothetical protein NC651_037909 [Populus alba x Populus x berolinensis]|nr:hypothetical protein NC651_037909 [Populus alba x Populus x berolinensis]